MEYVLLLAAFVLAGVICRMLWLWKFMPRSGKVTRGSAKRATQLRQSISEIESRKLLERKIALADLMKHIPVIGLSEDKRAEIKRLITAVDKRVEGDRLVLVEEIYAKQLQIAGAVVGLSILGMIVTPMAIFGIALTPIVMNFAINDLKEEQHQTSMAISSQFFEFFKTYYVQFRRPDATNTLSSVIEGFMPRANPEFRRVLSRLLSDLESGEDYALRQFDNRFSDNIKVHKFCSIVRARSKGDIGSYDSMRSFFEELEEQRDNYYDEELARRTATIGRVVMIYLVTVFSLIMIVQIIGMTRS